MIHLQPASNPVEKEEPSPYDLFHRGMFRIVRFYRYYDTDPMLARIKMPDDHFAAFVRFTVKQKYDFHPRQESWWSDDDGTVEVKITGELLDKIPEYPRRAEQPINKVMPINIGPIV